MSKTARALNKLLFERLLRYDSKEPFFGLPLCRHAAKFSFLYAHLKPVLRQACLECEDEGSCPAARAAVPETSVVSGTYCHVTRRTLDSQHFKRFRVPDLPKLGRRADRHCLHPCLLLQLSRRMAAIFQSTEQ